MRKWQWEALDRKASHRSWHQVYAVQHGISLAFYKDRKSKLQEITYQKEPPIDLTNAEVEVATDYTKRKHVFSLKLPGGIEYLFQAKDDDEVNYWISCIQTAAGGGTEKGEKKASTMPADSGPAGKKEKTKGKGGFFTLGKKK